MYKVLIPSAGLGTRLGETSKNLNKALVALDNKPVISHVIEKFPKHIEIVLALGYKGDLLKQYLDMAHSDRNITYVNVSKFQGDGAGLGLTVLECKKYLQCPFIFCTNDTVILEEIPEPTQNWVGFAEIENNKNYRSFKISKNYDVEKVCEKQEASLSSTKPYIGLAAIKDYNAFWQSMEKGRNYGSIQSGESYAIKAMLEQDIRFKAKKFTWYDTGNIESLEYAKNILRSENSPEILEKPNEAIWFVNGRVIKYSADSSFISERVSRATRLKGYVPEITANSKNMYSYRMLNGQVISKAANSHTFFNLLQYLEHFWEPVKLTTTQSDEFKKTCNKFYKDKTNNRVKLYLDRFSEQDEQQIINGKEIPTVKEVLNKVPWGLLEDGQPHRFHGDLHFENILLCETGQFCLLDWRQNFGGLQEYGDIYYDFAKILHGLIVSHELVNKECFTILQNENIVSYDLHRKHSLVKNETNFLDFLDKRGYNVYKVKIITYLIFLNIAALHHYPYSKLLFYLGKDGLYNLLESESEF